MVLMPTTSQFRTKVAHLKYGGLVEVENGSVIEFLRYMRREYFDADPRRPFIGGESGVRPDMA